MAMVLQTLFQMALTTNPIAQRRRADLSRFASEAQLAWGSKQVQAVFSGDFSGNIAGREKGSSYSSGFLRPGMHVQRIIWIDSLCVFPLHRLGSRTELEPKRILCKYCSIDRCDR